MSSQKCLTIQRPRSDLRGEAKEPCKKVTRPLIVQLYASNLSGPLSQHVMSSKHPRVLPCESAPVSDVRWRHGSSAQDRAYAFQYFERRQSTREAVIISYGKVRSRHCRAHNCLLSSTSLSGRFLVEMQSHCLPAGWRVDLLSSEPLRSCSSTCSLINFGLSFLVSHSSLTTSGMVVLLLPGHMLSTALLCHF